MGWTRVGRCGLAIDGEPAAALEDGVDVDAEDLEAVYVCALSF